jgi:hypothetical protein
MPSKREGEGGVTSDDDQRPDNPITNGRNNQRRRTSQQEDTWHDRKQTRKGEKMAAKAEEYSSSYDLVASLTVTTAW